MNHAEPDDIETLDLEVSEPHGRNKTEYIRLAVVDEDARETGRASFVMAQFEEAPSYLCKHLQSFITVDEIDAMIAALQEAKARLIALTPTP